MKNISPARNAAYEILFRIEKEKAYSSVLLPQYEENLDPRDGGLCHELVLGVLRRKIYLDKIVEQITKKNTAKFDLEVLLALRLGIYQILFLDKIPVYSAINESVNLVHRAKKRSATGLVNAVLRKISKAEEFNFEYVDDVERVSIQTSHPRWLIEAWIKQFGADEAEKIANANNTPPNAAFRFTRKSVARGETAKNAILVMLADLTPKKSEQTRESYSIENSNKTVRDFAASGEIYFQDEASQLIAEICDVKENEIFIDVCAAPGSKTTFIAANSNPKLIVAGDFYDHRIKTLRENCINQRAKSVSFARYDAAKALPFAETSFDAVLLDSPCSGTGTIRHNPEIRYFLSEKDLTELPQKQLLFLEQASKLVKSGGRIIYSTCSLETQENEEVIENFLAANDDFDKVQPKVEKQFVTGRGFSRTFPSRDSIDGFFAAVLTRK